MGEPRHLLIIVILSIMLGCGAKEPEKKEPSAVEKGVQDMTGISVVKEGEEMKKKILKADSLTKKRLEETMEGLE